MDCTDTAFCCLQAEQKNALTALSLSLNLHSEAAISRRSVSLRLTLLGLGCGIKNSWARRAIWPIDSLAKAASRPTKTMKRNADK